MNKIGTISKSAAVAKRVKWPDDTGTFGNGTALVLFLILWPAAITAYGAPDFAGTGQDPQTVVSLEQYEKRLIQPEPQELLQPAEEEAIRNKFSSFEKHADEFLALIAESNWNTLQNLVMGEMADMNADGVVDQADSAASRDRSGADESKSENRPMRAYVDNSIKLDDEDAFVSERTQRPAKAAGKNIDNEPGPFRDRDRGGMDSKIGLHKRA